MYNPSQNDTDASTSEQADGWLRRSRAHWLRLLETIGVIVLSMAALATSWSTYQSGRWRGMMSMSYGQASTQRIESVRASQIANRQIQVDLQLFSGWLDATAAGNKQLADFYQARFRPEFAPAFNAWLASNPLTNTQALRSPFEQPEYTLAAAVEADRLENQASQTFATGVSANDIGDDYVFNAVLLALALFFAGMSSRFATLRVRGALVLMALGLLLIGMVNLIRYPIY